MTGLTKPVKVRVMSMPPPRHESFKLRLRRSIDEQDLTIAEVARRLDPDDPSRGERNLYRWLSPSETILPSPASRKALARALGRDPDFFEPNGVVSLEGDEFWDALTAFRDEHRRRLAWSAPARVYGGSYSSQPTICVGATRKEGT